MSRGQWAGRVLVLVAVMAAIQCVGKPMWRAHRRATILAEDFQAGRAGWNLDSLRAGTRMNHLWFSEDGRSLWVADLSAGMTRWDLSTWRVTEQVKGHPGYCVLGASSTGVLACASAEPDEGPVELREARTWRRLGAGRGRADWLIGPSVLSLDGRQLLYSSRRASFDCCTRLLDVANPRGEAVLFKDSPVQAAFSRDGFRLVTLHRDRTLWLTLWDTRSRRQVGIVAVNARFDERMLCLLSDGYTALVRAYGSQQVPDVLELRDMRSGSLKAPRIPCSAAHDSPLIVSPDERRIAWFDESGEVFVQDLAPPHVTVKPRGQAPEYCGPGGPWLLAFSPDGSHLASTVTDGVVRVWNLDEGREEGNLVCYQDGGWLAVQCGDGRFVCSPGAEKHLSLRKGTALYDATPYLQRFCSSP